MLNEAHYGAVLNFFYFLLLDEGLALNAAYKTVKIVQKKLKNQSSAQHEVVLISTMSSVLAKYRKRRNHSSHSIQPPVSDWKCPNQDYLAAWKEYMRRGTDDFGETLVLRYILGYQISEISKGLEVPEGTIYFRLERGLESFAQGSFLQTAVRK